MQLMHVDAEVAPITEDQDPAPQLMHTSLFSYVPFMPVVEKIYEDLVQQYNKMQSQTSAWV